MRAEKSVIVLEFNELSPSLIEQFINAGKLPNFQRFYQESEVYITDAGEQPPYLEPWIQWVTVHTGVPYSQHQIFNLDDGHKLKFLNIWDRLSDAAYKVWVCGSMNLCYKKSLNGCILPDYWATQQTPSPDELSPFFNFVRKQVQEHTNDAVGLSLRDGSQFLQFMVTHGLSIDTLKAIAKQLFKERTTGKYRWQRATILDKLQRDIFLWYYRKIKPHFSTFFLNSTAHFQHLHWRNMEPTAFQTEPSAEEQVEYEEAILYGYQEMDKLIGDFFKVADDQTTLVLCTALSQQPCLTYEDIGGKHLYRPYKFEKLLKFAGVNSDYDCSPVMAEEFFIRFDNDSDAQVAEQKLAALRVNQRGALRLRRSGGEIYAGCGIFQQLSDEAILRIENSSESIPFFEVFYQIKEIKSGMHHPEGILWIRHPSLQHTVHPKKLSLEAISPKIMDILGMGITEDAARAPSQIQQLV